MVTSADRSLTALLGASPGASVSTNVIVQIVQKCFADKLKTTDGHRRMKAVIPTFDEDLTLANMAERQKTVSDEAMQSLRILS